MNKFNQIINNFQKARVAVIGDLCLDMYYFLTDEKSEVSVETGLKTRSVSDFAQEAGGAGNVAINLKMMGASVVDAYGVVGPDSFGKTLISILEEADVNCGFIQTQSIGWNTHVYHKLYKDGREEPRCDIGNFNITASNTIDSMICDLESNISGYQAVIINEQITHGYHNEYFQKKLSELIERHEDKCCWITDCRHLNHIYNKTIRKLNIHEARGLFFGTVKNEDQPPENEELIKWLHAYWKKPLVITLGEDGAITIDRNGHIDRVNGINIIGQTDTVGAGDAFLSGFALTLASGGEIREAIEIGNLSAGVSVTKIFKTGHPTAEEVLRMGISTDYRYNPDTANDKRRAVFITGTPIELIELPKTAIPKVAIFDHDGTISTLRQGWEPIMKEVCMDAIIGDLLTSLPTEEIDKIDQAASDMIEKTTGVQTIVQMHHLRKMVISFGYIPEEEILSPLEYKSIYNEKLLTMVSGRVELFRKGLLDVNDLTMKGALKFLDLLRTRGVLIYLASGTDKDDVQREAEILGYDNFFNGGIFGSVGNTSSDPKREVIDTIIKDLPDEIKAEECYVFGDGPVEMREAAKRNFTRIGLVSDEKQRFGINPEKRQRLILGGAQALIPDFSWIPALAEHLGWEY